MRSATQHHIQLGGCRIGYRLLRSKTARKLRLRVGPRGVEVMQPRERTAEEATEFLVRSQAWVIDQLRRVEGLRHVRRPGRQPVGDILYRGLPTKVRIEPTPSRAREQG